MNKLMILVCVISIGSGGVLLTNGDFEQTLTTGWQQQTSGSSITIDRQTTYDPDPNYEVQVYKGAGSGYARLLQEVAIPTTDLEFSIAAKMYAFDNNADTLCWAGAAVIVSYKNAAGSVLGETRICQFTTPCPWTSSSTLHLIFVSDSLWHTYSFNVDDELLNLPGVNPANVASIEVALYDTTAHTC